ncbi:hypothetical protein PG991_005291 [Apiospora marii]|uniref:Uncharacterized protein n=1 Tax=Apiospora marii TaxID=335849 RepID=A0ABR1S8R9_9PEZI
MKRLIAYSARAAALDFHIAANKKRTGGLGIYVLSVDRADVQPRLLVVVGLAGAFVGRGGRSARAAGDGHTEDLKACRGALLRLLQALLEASLGVVREGHLEHIEVAGPAAGADVVRLDALEGEAQRHVVDDGVEALVDLGLAAARGVVARHQEVVGPGLGRAARLPERLPLAALALARADIPDHVVLRVGRREARDLLGVRLEAAQRPGGALVHVGRVHGVRSFVLAYHATRELTESGCLSDLAQDVGVDRAVDLACLVLDLDGRVPPALVQVPELFQDAVLVGLRVLGPLATVEHVLLVHLLLLLLLVRVALLPRLQLRAEFGELVLGRRAGGVVLGEFKSSEQFSWRERGSR